MRFQKIALAALLFCGSIGASEPAREKLLLLLSGEWVSRGIYAATKLEIADHLQQGPRSAEELGRLAHAHPEALQRLLHMLAGFGVFEEVSPGVFGNTDASLLLSKSSPETLHSLSIFFGEDIHKSWDELLPAVQTGATAFQLVFKQPVFSYFKDHPSRGALFHAAMREKSGAVIRSTLSAYDFGRFKSVCDIGGGQGHFLQAMVRQNPQVQGMLFDLPEVIDSVKNSHPSFDLSAGDFFLSIPEGEEAYVMKSVLHDWDDEKCEKILRNCRKAMGEGSRLLIIEAVLLPKDQSLYANCMDLLMFTVTGGKERALASFERLLDRSGFVLDKVIPTSTEFSILEAHSK